MEESHSDGDEPKTLKKGITQYLDSIANAAGSNARPKSGVDPGAPSLTISSIVEKDPDEPMQSVDKLLDIMEPSHWKNVPLPVVDTLRIIISSLQEIKKFSKKNLKNNDQVKNTIVVNHATQVRDIRAIKIECLQSMTHRENKIMETFSQQKKHLERLMEENEHSMKE